jgi:plastocyanin
MPRALHRILAPLGIALVLATGAVALFSEKQQSSAAPSASKPGGTTVDMVDLAFEPRALTIKRGQRVTFRNRGKVTHNAKGKTFFSRVVEPGGSYRHTFKRAGTFEYLCTFHPGMEGKLTVR